MWILDFLPSWIFTLITLVGIGGLIAAQFLKFVPFITTYRLPIQVGSIIVLAFGLYMMGGAACQEKWEARVKELEAKVAIAEQQSKTANAELVSVVKEKKQLIKQQDNLVKDRITQSAAKIDAECKVPEEAIDILNQAAGEPK